MKRTFVSLLAFITAVTCAFGLTACEALSGLLGGNGSSSPAEETLIASVESTTKTTVAIKVEQAGEKTTLFEVMEYLQKENELTFQVSGGMITEINGRANAADWSACWMLYISDTEFADTECSYEYNGQVFGSAILGAETLPVINGGVYVWEYQEF